MNILIFLALLQIKLFSIFRIRKLFWLIFLKIYWDDSPGTIHPNFKWGNKFSVRDFKMIVDGWYFHLDCFVADNCVAVLLEEENSISFLSFLFCFHCRFSKLTAQGHFSVTETQNNFKRGTLSLSLSLSQNGNKWHGIVSFFLFTFYGLSARPTSQLRNSFNHKKFSNVQKLCHAVKLWTQIILNDINFTSWID